MMITDYIPDFANGRAIFDIAAVFIIVYVILRLLRGTRAVPTVAGIVILALLYWFAATQDLATLEFVLRYAVFYLPFLIIILFSSEIRQALIYFGNRFRLPFLRKQQGTLGETIYDEIVLAATTLSSTKIGALIVLERSVGLRNFIDAGVQIDARLNYDLLVTIFNPATSLHDGAVIIRRERIASASCFLPLTKNPNISREFGTRHRAAIGVTEGTDAISVVVSEETGLISFIEDGEIHRNLETKQLRKLLLDSMDVSLVSSKGDKGKKANESESKGLSDTDSEVAVS